MFSGDGGSLGSQKVLGWRSRCGVTGRDSARSAWLDGSEVVGQGTGRGARGTEDQTAGQGPQSWAGVCLERAAELQMAPMVPATHDWGQG